MPFQVKDNGNAPGSGSPGVVVADEGSPLGLVETLNFIGSAVSVAVVPGEANVTISGSGGGIDGIITQDEGVTEGTDQTTLNFVGAGVSVASVGDTTTVTITGTGGSGNSYFPGGW